MTSNWLWRWKRNHMRERRHIASPDHLPSIDSLSRLLNTPTFFTISSFSVYWSRHVFVLWTVSNPSCLLDPSLSNQRPTFIKQSGKTRTFKPRKDVPEGTKQYQLRKYAEATLVSVIDTERFDLIKSLFHLFRGPAT